MKFKLSYKIFIVFTLTSFMIVILMVGLIQFYVARNFGEYITRSALEKFSDFANALTLEYKKHKGWQTLQNNPERWEQILQANLPAKIHDKPRDFPRPPEIENKEYGSSAHDRPPPSFADLLRD